MGWLDEQDEYGMTALSLACASSWKEGIDLLLHAKANTELRYFRTGETALYTAVLKKDQAIIQALLGAGASPDAANYWGMTPRIWATRYELSALLDSIPVQEVTFPEPRIQNAEHLADHYYPRFKIPDREERETLQPTQAVDLYVYGPKSESKQDTIKVRITKRSGRRPKVRYRAAIETPIERTHLPSETKEVEFGPENIASVYIARNIKSKKTNK